MADIEAYDILMHEFCTFLHHRQIFGRKSNWEEHMHHIATSTKEYRRTWSAFPRPGNKVRGVFAAKVTISGVHPGPGTFRRKFRISTRKLKKALDQRRNWLKWLQYFERCDETGQTGQTRPIQARFVWLWTSRESSGTPCLTVPFVSPGQKLGMSNIVQQCLSVLTCIAPQNFTDFMRWGAPSWRCSSQISQGSFWGLHLSFESSDAKMLTRNHSNAKFAAVGKAFCCLR